MASLGPELIAQIGPMPITNTLITTLVVDAVIFAVVFTVNKKISLIPTGLQSVFEAIIDYFYDLTHQISGAKAKTIFPWFASFFFFIFFANIIGLMPGFGTIGIWEEGSAHTSQPKAENEHNSITESSSKDAHQPNSEESLAITKDTSIHSEEADTNVAAKTTNPPTAEQLAEDKHSDTQSGSDEHETEKHLIPVLRAATSDFNMTLALGTISILATHIISIQYNGIFGYANKFLSKNPINLFIGLLEFALEFVKIFSLSFRLFGNIFAGEIVLITVAGLAAYSAFLAPIPFLLLETIVALVQALVFAMLTMVFMSLLATTSSEGGGH